MSITQDQSSIIHPFNILIVSDSRGKRLENHISEALHELGNNSITVTVVPHSGATITALLSPTIDLISATQYHVVIVMAGVNNLTTLNRAANGKTRISPKYYEVGNLVDCMVKQYESFKQEFTYATKGKQCLLFTELIGANYSQWNKVINDYPVEQAVINESIPLINQILWAMNKDTGFPGPHLQNSVHELVKGKRVHKYKRMPDGLHADLKTAKVWAKLIARNAIVIQRMYSARTFSNPIQN